MILLSASLVVYGAVNKTRYDLFRDFAPVSQVAAAPYLLTVTPSLPVKSVKELVAHAKASPAKLNYASTGSASLAHPDSFSVSVEDGDPLADNDDYAEWKEQRQMEIMNEQDQALDGVFQTVGNLRQQADTMGRELEEQAELLEDTDTIAERVGGKLAKGMKGIRFVIERNEGE